MLHPDAPGRYQPALGMRRIDATTGCEHDLKLDGQMQRVCMLSHARQMPVSTRAVQITHTPELLLEDTSKQDSASQLSASKMRQARYHPMARDRD